MVCNLLGHVCFIACNLLFAKCILHPANDLRFGEVCIWCERRTCVECDADRAIYAAVVRAVCSIKGPVYGEYYVGIAVQFWV